MISSQRPFHSVIGKTGFWRSFPTSKGLGLSKLVMDPVTCNVSFSAKARSLLRWMNLHRWVDSLKRNTDGSARLTRGLGATSPLPQLIIRYDHRDLPCRIHQRPTNIVRDKEMPFGRRQVRRPASCDAEEYVFIVAIQSHRSGFIRRVKDSPGKVGRTVH